MIYETYSCKNLLNYFSPQHIYLRFVTSKKLPFQQCITSQRFQLLNLGPFCPLLFKNQTSGYDSKIKDLKIKKLLFFY